MSKAASGLFSGTKGSNSGSGTSSKPTTAQIKRNSHERIKTWAEKKIKELTGKAKNEIRYYLVIQNMKGCFLKVL